MELLGETRQKPGMAPTMSIAKTACVSRSQKLLDNGNQEVRAGPEYCVPPVCQILLAARTFFG